MPLSEHILCVPRVSDFDEEANAIIHYNPLQSAAGGVGLRSAP